MEAAPPGVPENTRPCAVCGDELGGDYFRVGHLLSALKLAVCRGCFGGRRTWMALGEEYFPDYLDHYEELKAEVAEHYERQREQYDG
jgi:hypothetical protein